VKREAKVASGIGQSDYSSLAVSATTAFEGCSKTKNEKGVK
jgi:hypothetical protein